MASLRASTPLARPMPVTIAVILSVLNVIGNFAGFALPTGGADVPVIVVVSSIVLGVAGIPAAIGLWMLRRWGYILTLVVTALNVLASIPGIPAGPTTAIKVFSAVFGVISVAIIVLVLRPESRRAYS
jgi:uncharacterized membrane protein (DUF2068 family)